MEGIECRKHPVKTKSSKEDDLMPSKPILPLCVCGDPLCKIHYGYCHCGCGNKTGIARRTDSTRGHICGHHHCYANGHKGVPRPDVRYSKIGKELIVYVPLTKGKWAVVDREDLWKVASRRWFFTNGYAA